MKPRSPTGVSFAWGSHSLTAPPSRDALYAAWIEDLAPGDFLKVDRAACCRRLLRSSQKAVVRIRRCFRRHSCRGSASARGARCLISKTVCGAEAAVRGPGGRVDQMGKRLGAVPERLPAKSSAVLGGMARYQRHLFRWFCTTLASRGGKGYAKCMTTGTTVISNSAIKMSSRLSRLNDCVSARILLTVREPLLRLVTSIKILAALGKTRRGPRSTAQ